MDRWANGCGWVRSRVRVARGATACALLEVLAFWAAPPARDQQCQVQGGDREVFARTRWRGLLPVVAKQRQVAKGAQRSGARQARLRRKVKVVWAWKDRKTRKKKPREQRPPRPAASSTSFTAAEPNSPAGGAEHEGVRALPALDPKAPPIREASECKGGGKGVASAQPLSHPPPSADVDAARRHVEHYSQPGENVINLSRVPLLAGGTMFKSLPALLSSLLRTPSPLFPSALSLYKAKSGQKVECKRLSAPGAAMATELGASRKFPSKCRRSI